MSSLIFPQFSGEKAAIIGFGVEGSSAAKFLLEHGADVTVYDERGEDAFSDTLQKLLTSQGAAFSLGEIGDLSEYDLIVRSPGVPLSQKELTSAQERKQEITSVTKLFFDLAPCPIIGVTGTKGKGTTSTLIYEMLKKEGKDVYLGGNIGTPALDFLDRLSTDSVVVLELSSFQLLDLHKSPHIAVMLMVTSEHLDYHKDVMEYVNAKRNILSYQTGQDYAIINRDYIASRESDIHTSGKTFQISREDEPEEGVFIRDSSVIARVNGTEGKIIDIDNIKLVGSHNLENIAAAVMAALLSGVSKKHIQEVLKTFKGLEHRLEFVREVNGVVYYDDSFSTTPETAQAAIESFDNPEVLILGGSGKNSDFTRLGELISDKENIKAIIGIGKEWKAIKSKIIGQTSNMKIIEGLKSMKEVVQVAADVAESGDVVLLTPACASFDMFNDYKDRGNQFKKAVSDLK